MLVCAVRDKMQARPPPARALSRGYDVANDGPTDFCPKPQNRRIWLLAVAALILAMVAVGGLTRLTGSGLSITQWDPIMGAVPPMSDAQWQDAFAKYQLIPQYRLENHGMSLEGFKAHLLVGMGAPFARAGCSALCSSCRSSGSPGRARSRARNGRACCVLFALGGLQGFVGWWMVESGLETRVSVSPIPPRDPSGRRVHSSGRDPLDRAGISARRGRQVRAPPIAKWPFGIRRLWSIFRCCSARWSPDCMRV